MDIKVFFNYRLYCVVIVVFYCLLFLFCYQHNTVTETLDLSDNYLESSGAALLAAMLKDNSFIVSLVSPSHIIKGIIQPPQNRFYLAVRREIEKIINK